MSLKLLCKFGSDKTSDDTLLLNMGSAMLCPARAQCRVLLEGRKCYPAQVERLHPEVKLYRDRQEAYWLSTSAERITADIFAKIEGRTPQTRYMRFNESGDFASQACVEKLSQVASALKSAAGIITYGFTARDDLDFSDVAFLVKGSGHARGNNGRSAVIGPGDPVPEGHTLCPEDCRACDLCMRDTKADIAFVER
jgi:hypothetical protein